jgi:2-dehydro-3-deoxy-D-arabinonate dehydratase
MRFVRYVRESHVCIARETPSGSFEETRDGSMLEALSREGRNGSAAAATEVSPDVLEDALLIAPIDPPEVWCAGVTYERSREARVQEAAVDVYTSVYDARRPELFLKDAMWRRTVGPGEPIGVRNDSAWDVPEPEIGVVLGERGRILGVTVGNDVSSRSIEGENPLYLAQAKVYAGACAIGPAVYVPARTDETFEIQMRIVDETGTELFSGETSTARMRRSFTELVEWLVRDNPVPAGSVLLTGTGVVPPDEFTLRPGNRVEIHVPQIGTLSNPVVDASTLV